MHVNAASCPDVHRGQPDHVSVLENSLAPADIEKGQLETGRDKVRHTESGPAIIPNAFVPPRRDIDQRGGDVVAAVKNNSIFCKVLSFAHPSPHTRRPVVRRLIER